MEVTGMNLSRLFVTAAISVVLWLAPLDALAEYVFDYPAQGSVELGQPFDLDRGIPLTGNPCLDFVPATDKKDRWEGRYRWVSNQEEHSKELGISVAAQYKAAFGGGGSVDFSYTESTTYSSDNLILSVRAVKTTETQFV